MGGHVGLVLQPHEGSQRLGRHGPSARTLSIEQRIGVSYPAQRAIVRAPTVGAHDDCELHLTVVVNRLPHDERRTMGHTLCGNCAHGSAHRLHLEEVLSVAILPDRAVAVHDALDVFHVEGACLVLGEVLWARQFKPYVEPEVLDVPAQLVHDWRLEMLTEAGEQHTAVRWGFLVPISEVRAQRLRDHGQLPDDARGLVARVMVLGQRVHVDTAKDMFGSGLAGLQCIGDAVLEGIDDKDVPLRKKSMLDCGRWLRKATEEDAEGVEFLFCILF